MPLSFPGAASSLLPAAFPLLAPDGNAAAPSYAFSSTPATGFFFDLANTALRLQSGGANFISFDTNGGINFRVGRTLNAVNYAQAFGSTASGEVGFTVSGVDVNVPIALYSKGTGSFNFKSNAGVAGQFSILHTAGSTRSLTVTGSNGGNPILSTTAGSIALGVGIYPAQDSLAAQTTCAIYAGTGVPNNANGANGDFYFRGDTPGTVSQRVYIKSAGAWVALAI